MKVAIVSATGGELQKDMRAKSYVPRNPPTKRKTNFSTLIQEDQLFALREMSMQTGRSIGELTRSALDLYLQQEEKQR